MADATQQITPHAAQFFRLHHLKAKLGISGSHIWAMVKSGRFPKPVKLSENCTAWNAVDVERWAAERIAASNREPA